MRFGVKGKEAFAITLLTLLVVATTTFIHLSQLAKVVVQEVLQQTGLIKKQIYAQSSRSLSRVRGGSHWDILRSDRELRSLLDASVGYSPYLLYALIADRKDEVILHSERVKEGSFAPEKPRLQALLSLDRFQLFQVLYGGGEIYEDTLPLSLDGKPFGNIQLGIATSLLRRELNTSLKNSLYLAGLALPVAWLFAMGLGNLILKPIRKLTQEMDRLRRGEFEMGGHLGRGDEFGELASQLQLLGQQMQSDRLKMLGEKAQLQQVVDHLEDGIVLFTQDRRVLFFNKAAEDVVGWPLEQVMGWPWEEMLVPSHPLRPLLEQAFKQKSGFHNAPVVLPNAGGSKEYLVSVFFVTDAQETQETMGAMVLLKDLESIKTLQSLVSYSAKLTALGRLTSGVAHEVKNPLNAMTIHLELLKEKLDRSPEEVQQSLEVIGSEIRRLDRVVQRFLRFIRPEELSVKLLDLNALLRGVASLLEAGWKEGGIAFTFQFDPHLPLISGDEELLRQAFMNILLNACQAMPDGGKVRMSTEREDGFVNVSIADTGVGIPPEDLDKIFRLYYTTKAGGSGIGLSMVYRIVQMHDGVIDVFSGGDGGTTVTVRLPVR